MRKQLNRFWVDENGATAMEYGLIVALIAVAIIGGVTAMASGTNNTFATVSTELA